MELEYKRKSIYEKEDEEFKKEMFEHSDNYIKFLNYAKTEYRSLKYFTTYLEKNGFKKISDLDELNTGDKVYYINKDRSLYALVVGEDSIKDGINIIGSHIDSPRLDTKPMPLYETCDLALFKTQYYGGVKKYQWLTIPLSMFGVIYTENGEKIEVNIGEDDDDIGFTVSDILPHLAKDQMKLDAEKFIDPENMSVLVGSFKDSDTEEDKVKNNILKILNEKYGIKEIDFARSDIRFVPSFKSKYIGFDKSMVAGYGQDDRICAFNSLKALVDVSMENTLKKSCLAILVDKEEIGSVGNTSMSSDSFDLFISEVLMKTGSKKMTYEMLKTYNNSCMLSADVTACVDPQYQDVFDLGNASYLGCGIAIEKYTGSGGKYEASEASAKYMSYVMNIFDKNNISYQIGTLGKIGKGGGGTIAYILANKGIDVVDCGTAIMCMHSPYEIASTCDIYMTYKAYKSFYSNEE